MSPNNSSAVQMKSISDNRIVTYFKPPESTENRFIFPAEVYSHLPGFKMFPEYITTSLPAELEGKIKESEWSEWMDILIQDRKSHECGDSVGCCFLSCLSVVCCFYPCVRPVQRAMTMEKFIEKFNTDLLIPKGMFLKEQEGYVMGMPSTPGTPQCCWFTISLNKAESEKLKKEPKTVSLKI